MNEFAVQRIEEWHVTATGRLAGVLYHGSARKGTIRTSRVVEVRMMRMGASTDTYSVALTRSGSAYILGEPAPSWGPDRAAAFLDTFCRSGDSVSTEISAERLDTERTVTRLAGPGRKSNPDPAEVQYASLRGPALTYDIRAWRDGTYQIFFQGKLIRTSAEEPQHSESDRARTRSNWLQEAALLRARDYIESLLPDEA